MELKVLLFQECEQWVAQVLEHDITAQGIKTDDAIYELSRLIVGEILMREDLHIAPLDSIPPAPPVYWERYEHASHLDKHLAQIDLGPVPDIDCRLAA